MSPSTPRSIAAYDAVILAGGRAKRLSGRDKASLMLDGKPLLYHLLDDLETAQKIVVVGPDSLQALLTEYPRKRPEVLWAQESPAYAGPAAGIAAGIRELSAASSPNTSPTPYTALLAVDTPTAAMAIPALLAALAPPPDTETTTESKATTESKTSDVELALLIDSTGKPQLLNAVARTASLHRSVEANEPLNDTSVRRLLSELPRCYVPVPENINPAPHRDIDTPEDARALGIAGEI